MRRRPSSFVCFAMSQFDWAITQKQMKPWSHSQNRRFYFKVHSSFPFGPANKVKGGQHLPKAYGIKVRWYWEFFEEHVRNLGTLHFHPTTHKAASLNDPTSHWLHGNSIPKIGWHYFWPGLIALTKNTLPIKLNLMGNRPHQKEKI
jgi:hypothetical protein